MNNDRKIISRRGNSKYRGCGESARGPDVQSRPVQVFAIRRPILPAIDLVQRSTVIDMLCVITLDFAKETSGWQIRELYAADLQPFRIRALMSYPAVRPGRMDEAH
jgi:hypothetical protein